MQQHPFTFSVSVPEETLSVFDKHIVRRLSAMQGQYLDTQAFKTMLSQDPVLYEVYEINRPELAGELMNGITIVHPGKIGEEYFMTKGHFHNLLATAEVYYCLKGDGMMVMETPEGEWAVEELHPASVLYVPPRWAHRSVIPIRMMTCSCSLSTRQTQGTITGPLNSTAFTSLSWNATATHRS